MPPKHSRPVFHVWRSLLLCALLAGALLSGGCQSIYYRTMEGFGRHKRDILVSRVKNARDAQEDVKEQFASALEKFQAVLGTEGGKLQDKYDVLKKELDRSETRARTVRDRINAVEEVAEALFKEWERELKDYQDARLRASSERRLHETRARCRDLVEAMRRAESKIEPVLLPLRDQVLYLKHNLNAQAVAALQGELATVRQDVAALIRDMEKAIAEADSFIRQMDSKE